MLITNFAAGELSKTLFGRTDLQQYYRGAARMENFDVIPTGGLKRRSGTEQLEKLDETEYRGRIIPYIVDRDLGFLLYLTPLKITVYKLVGGIIQPDDGKPPIISGYEADEIGDVQYAQSFDTMVLCHKNHPPLEVKLMGEELEIEQLFFSFQKTLIAGTGITAADFAGGYNNYEDETYNNGRLGQDGHYPLAVCFYNGRLVFAATESERQRLFVSAVLKNGEAYNFSTKKVFMSEKREYAVLLKCRIDKKVNMIKLLDPEEFGKFTKNISEYYVQSPFFSEGAKIERINGCDLVIRGSAKTVEIGTDQLEAFLFWKNTIEAQTDNYWSQAYLYYYKEGGRAVISTSVSGYLNFSNGKFKYGYSDYTGYDGKVVEIPLAEAENCVTQISSLRTFVASKIGFITEVTSFNTFINDFFAYIQNKMSYTFTVEGSSFTLYGTPTQIYYQITGEVESQVDMPVVFYTREIIADEYPTPDCGFTFEIASDANDAIRWLAVNKGLIVGTETGEWIIPPDVHATNIQAKLNSRYGSDKIQGTAVGDATCFFQTGKKSLVEYYIPQQDNNFRANNMAMMVPEMLAESPVLDFDYISSPHTKLLITREDGTVVTLLYERSTGTFAWGRITTDGQIKSVAVLPGADGYDEIYLLVQRGDDFYLERLREDGAVYLDGWTKVDADNWDAVRELYEGDGVRVCRICAMADGRTKYEALYAGAAPDFARGGDFYIGYAYKSVLRTMPVLANNTMKKNNIVNLIFRFLESYAVKMTSILNGRVSDTNAVRDMDGPYTGIKRAAFPGSWAEDVQAEITSDEPAPVQILAINAEMTGTQGGQQ